MTPNVSLDPQVKKKLDSFKERLGIKTYSDAVNFLILNNEKLRELLAMIQENNALLKESNKIAKLWLERNE